MTTQTQIIGNPDNKKQKKILGREHTQKLNKLYESDDWKKAQEEQVAEEELKKQKNLENGINNPESDSNINKLPSKITLLGALVLVNSNKDGTKSMAAKTDSLFRVPFTDSFINPDPQTTSEERIPPSYKCVL